MIKFWWHAKGGLHSLSALSSLFIYLFVCLLVSLFISLRINIKGSYQKSVG